jgi:UDP-N-acetylglucosamine 2-epimerase
MIHIFVGTKAQFIKMAPIMRELDRREFPYNFIDAGQHAGITGDLIRQFNLRQPDVFLRDEQNNIDKIPEALTWFIGRMWRAWIKTNQISEQVFQGKQGICLVHGDTLSTLISVIYSRRCGLKVAHVEAGLRSYHLLDPFPEEIIRLIAMKYSDVLFTPSNWAYENLIKMGYAEKAVQTSGNTIRDAVEYGKGKGMDEELPESPYVVVTIHRVETIYTRSRMEKIVAVLKRIAETHRVLFVLHGPTRKQLRKFGFYEGIKKNPSIALSPLMPYLNFIRLLSGADFVITDGGSVQEESYFLNIPCLIMRNKTERLIGLGENACLAAFDEKKIQDFLNHYADSKSVSSAHLKSPSSEIVDYLIEERLWID